MSEDRVDIIRDFFLDFNRDPFKNKSLVEHYVNRLYDCNTGMLKMACEELSLSNDVLPKWKDVMNTYTRLKASFDDTSEYKYIDCDDCGGSGAIKSVFFGKMELYSLNFKGNGAVYYDVIIGKCHCTAGGKMPGFFEVRTPPKFIKDYAKELDFDCCYATLKIVTDKNKELRECTTSELTQESTEDVPF